MVKFEKVIQEPLQHAIQTDSTYGLRTSGEAYRIPLLRVLVDLGGRAPSKEVIDQVGEYMKDALKEYDYTPLESTGQPRWRNTTQWERSNFVKEGLMSKDSPRGIWEISDKGRAWLAEQERSS